MIRRGIVIVHGIGTQRHGSELDTVLEPLMTFLGRGVGQSNARLVVRNPRDDQGTASARITIGPPGVEPIEEWHVREAWWAHVFPSSDSATMLGWAVRAFFATLSATWRLVFWRNVRRFFDHHVQPDNDGIWQVPVARSPYPFLNLVVWIAVMLGYTLVYLAGAILLVPLYAFLLIPGWLLWPAAARGVQKAIVNLFTGGIGEQQATTNRYVAVSEAATIVTEALRPFLDPSVLAAHGIEYDTVTVVAHSGGCVVSYEALAGPVVSGWIAQGTPGKRLTWMTIGSGLNLGWLMHARNHARDRAFWSRPLHRFVNWINIYARYDPVPQGEPADDLIGNIAGPRPRPFVSIRVANTDSPLTDHTTYWDNREEVMSRIVHVIADSRLGREPLQELLDGTPSPQSLLDPAVERALAGSVAHRRDVVNGMLVRIALGLVAIAGLLSFSGTVERLGRWAADHVGTPPPTEVWHTIAGWLPNAIGWLHIHDTGHWLAGATIVVYGAIIVALVWGLLRQWLDWRRSQSDDLPPKWPAAHPRAPAASAENPVKDRI